MAQELSGGPGRGPGLARKPASQMHVDLLLWHVSEQNAALRNVHVT